jgi:tetraacyldisaccharide 4'-kinase
MLRILLLPFAVLYNIIAGIRNRLYDIGFKPSIQFEIPVIGVGNLSVGGTGKTPMIEHLVRLLHTNYNVATLSRGYGRKTKGMRIGNSLDDASTLGDEPYQFYRKFNAHITVAVGEDRAYAIPNIIHQFPDTQVVLLDDAYQHRRVRPTMNILLTDYNRPFYSDFLLPAGRLRESRNGAERANVIVVTKCPEEITDDKMMKIEKSVRSYADHPVFFTKIRYGFPQAFGNAETIGDRVVLVSGIANAKLLEDYVRNNFKMVRHIAYADHHDYTVSELDQLLRLVNADSQITILTTEKDMVKIDSPAFKSITSKLPLFYLPIEIEFIKNGKDFDEMVLTSIQHVANN